MSTARNLRKPNIETKALPISGRMLALEPRYVFDAAIATELHDLVQDTHGHDHAAYVAKDTGATIVAAAHDLAAMRDVHDVTSGARVLHVDASTRALVEAHNLAPSNHEIAFIDTRLADLQTLINSVPEGTRVVLIDGSRDGVAQMVDALRGEQGVVGIHILSHGSQGHIELGTSTLDQATMSTIYKSALTSIHGNLAAGADILVYGCDFGAGAEGARAATMLASLTGADVAASTNLTGAVAGADWVLEQKTGAIQSATIVAADWHHDMLTITTTDGVASTTRGTPINGSLAGQATTDTGTAVQYQLADSSGNVLAVGATFATAHGSVTITNPATGAYTYTPAVGYVGTDAFSFAGVAVDAQGSIVTGVAVEQITIDNLAIAVANEANPVAYQSTFNGTLVDNVTANPGGLPLTYTITQQPAHGTLVFNADGTFVYTANAGYSGLDSFHFQASDGSSDPGNGIVDLTVAPPPLQGWLFSTATSPGTSVTLPFSGQSSDTAAGSVVQFALDPAHLPQHGTVSINNATGTYTYTADPGYIGPDSFQFLLTDQFGNTSTASTNINSTASGHDVPVAPGDWYTITADTPLLGNLSRGELPTNGVPEVVNVQSITQPSHGVAVLNPNGTYTYTPNTAFVGTDTFTYTVIDQYGQTATGIETIIVNAPPLGTTGLVKFAPIGAPVAFNLDSQSVHSTSDPYVISQLTYTITQQPAHGTLTVDAHTGAVTYVPNAGWSGVDTFKYDVFDGFNHVAATDTVVSPNHIYAGSHITLVASGNTVTGSTAGISGAPSGTPVWTQVTNPAHGTATMNSDGTYSYAAGTGFTGLDKFAYTIVDGNGHAARNYLYFYTASAATPGNNPPVATAIPDRTNLDSSSPSVNLATYFSDPDGHALTYSAAGLPDGLTIDPVTGVVSGVVDSSASQAQINGVYTVTVFADDGHGGVVQQTFDWTINNPVPVANPFSITTPFNTPTVVGLLANDTDPDGDALTVVSATVPASQGSVAFNGTDWVFTPASGFTGIATINYTIQDIDGASASSTHTVSVAPQATNETYYSPINTPVNGNAASGDTASVGSVFTATSAPAVGSVSMNADGTYVYTPPAGFTGTVSFNYLVTDSVTGLTATAVETINILAPPHAVNDAFSTPYQTPVSGDATLNGDTYAPGSSFAATSTPAHGTVTMSANGTYVYTPAAGFTGTDTFTYRITDLAGQTTTATETITVGPHATNDSYVTALNTSVSGNATSNGDVYQPGSTFTAATQPLHGSVTMASNGTYVYVPAAGYSGIDTFAYTIFDPATGLSSSATETITILAPPVAVNDSYTTPYQTPVNGNAAANGDVFAPGSTFAPSSAPSHGSVTMSSNGSYVYTPAAGFTGTDTFTYTITDPAGQTATATETIKVGPHATNDGYTTPVNTALNGNAAANGDVYQPGSTFAATSSPSHGSVTMTTNGTYVYTPATGYTGVDTFTYTVTDPATGLSSTATETITILAPPAPVAVNDSYATPYQTGVNGNAAANGDSFAPGATFAPSSAPSHGTVTMSSNGTYVYVPAAGFTGTDTFTYTITDPAGQTATATETISVGPHATNDGYSTQVNTPLNGNAAANGDVYQPGSMFAATSTPSHGSVTMASDGSYVYVPTTGYTGVDTFTYIVTDPLTGLAATATETITITAPTAPVAVNDSYATPFQTAVSGNAAAGDTYAPGSTFAQTTTASHGTVSMSSTGAYVYTPAAGFVGIDTFTYTITDPAGQTATATETIAVGPHAVNDSYTTLVNTPLNGNAAGNGDIYTPGSTFSATSLPSHGTVMMASDGSYVYVPATGYTGTDTFTYKVTDPVTGLTATAIETITIAAPGAPVAINDSYTTPFQTAVSGNAAANGDTYAAGSTFTATSAPAHGSIAFNADGTYVYTPAAGFVGVDTFTYRITDPAGQTATATETISVGPRAVNDSYATPFNTPLNGDASTGDSIAPGSTFAAASQPTHGSVTMASNGTYVYVPAPNYSGTDTFTYIVTDPATGLSATAVETITITAPSLPVAVNDAYTTPYQTTMAGDARTGDTFGPGSTFSAVTQPSNGTLSFNPNGTYSYTPAVGFVGTETFTYRITDAAGQSVTAIEIIRVTPPALVAVNDAYTTPFNTAVNGNAAVNDTFALGSGFTVITAPTHGTVSMNSDGTYIYTPTPGFHGVDMFAYAVTDPTGQTKFATDTITVAPAPGPTAVNDSYATGYVTPVAGNAATGDTYLPGSTFTATAAPTHGTLVFNPDGTYSYTPAAGFTGVDTFTYRVTDVNGNSATATETITVGAPTLAVVNDAYTGVYGTPVAGNAATGDTFAAGSTFAPVAAPLHGTVTMNPNGTYVYTPAVGFAGTDTFTYRITDPTGATIVATETITITPPTLIAVNDSYTTAFNTPVSGNAASGDTFAPGSTFAATSAPSKGVVTMSANGTYTYTPPLNFAGTVTFTYRVTDPTGQVRTATETIVVTPPVLIAANDAYATPFNTPLNGNAAKGDTFAAGSTFKVTGTAGHGTVAMNADGTYKYTPQRGYAGTDTFTYQITDPTGRTVTATETITIARKPSVLTCLTTFGHYGTRLRR